LSSFFVSAEIFELINCSVVHQGSLWIIKQTKTLRIQQQPQQERSCTPRGTAHVSLSRTSCIHPDRPPHQPQTPSAAHQQLQIDLNRFTGVPLKQMTAVSRYGHGGRRAYGVMSNVNGSVNSPVGAPGTPVVGHGNVTQSSTISSSQQPKNPKLYKTELCRSWMDHGRCNYGDRCQYAHGEHEKRPIPRHPKYKTAYCQSYHQLGYCPYGPRCHFIHNEEPSTINAARNNTVTFTNTTAAVRAPKAVMMAMSAPATAVGHAQGCGGSTGESPVPSSAGSGSESPLGSASPSLDLDDNASSMSTTSWSTFAGNSRNTPGTYFNWPSVTFNAMDILGGATALGYSWNGCSFTSDLDSVGLLNDFLGWSLEDIPSPSTYSNQPSTNEHPPRARLPVFAQISNASSASS
uniref:Tristetraprolin n=1 Tax=Toxocara canis TaxID=6265 RepID=A0A183V7D6_TOXCA